MKIAFHSYQLGERGTEVCLYDYAKYNQEILGNESIIVSTSSRPTPTLKRFEDEFKTILYPDVWQHDGKNDQLRTTLEKIVDTEKVDVFYAIKGGENDGVMPKNCKSVTHNIFRMDEPHGDVYAGVCKYICERYNSPHPWVHHIVNRPKENTSLNLREQLGIPADALVLGRHGGYDTFNLPFAHKAILDVLEKRKDIYFIFLSTRPFGNHERLKFIDWTKDIQNVYKFINTCDAMMHGRGCGEVFSLSIADFSVRNKPIITWPSGRDTGHVYTLKDKGIYYNDEQELTNILLNLTKEYIKNNNWDVYGDTFTAQQIMLNEFKPVFLD